MSLVPSPRVWVAGFWLLLRVFHFHFLRFSSSWIVLLPDIFIRPLFRGFHCFGYSSGQGSGYCLPVWVWRIVYLWSSNFFAVSLLLHFGLLPPQAGGLCCFQVQQQSRGFHRFGYSSGQGSGCCLPVWVWRTVYLWSSNFC